MSQVEFTEHLLAHVEGRRRWPMVISLAIDVVLSPEQAEQARRGQRGES